METTHTDLFEVFGGRDNLRLMCGAKRFRVTMDGCQVSFWVGDDIVRLQGGGVYYVILVQDRRTKRTRSQYTSLFVENIRRKFEQVTGYSLDF